MSKLESYIFLFSDTIFGNILLYAHNEFVLYIMKAMGGYNLNKCFIIAISGFSVAVIFNYFCGFVLLKIYLSTVDTKKQRNYKKFYDVFHKYGILILCSNIFPLFGSFIPLLAGFASYGIHRSALIAIISKIPYYLYYIYL